MDLRPGSSKVMSFSNHVEELRRCLMRCLWIFCLGFILFYTFSDFFLDVLKKPLFDVLPLEQRRLYFTQLFESLMTHLKIAGYASCFFLSPLYFYQFWSFLAPGLMPQERKWVIPFVLGSSFFFLLGICFTYFFVFPVGFRYLMNYGNPTDVPLLTMDAYFGTCLKLLLLFGGAFELPVLIFFLGITGVVNASLLRQNRRYALLAITVFSALFAPPDAISMVLLAAPLLLLYEAALLSVQFWERSQVGKNPQDAPEEAFHPLEGRSRNSFTSSSSCARTPP